MLYVITGVRGAGKTTLIENVRKFKLGQILQPSTTRSPRFEGEMEYDFVSEWSMEHYAWTISVGEHKYGMRLSEITKTSGAPAFTVFEPISIDVFYHHRRATGLAAITVGLDTVPDVAEQHQRVSMMQSRMMTPEEFQAALNKVRETDVVVSGDEVEVVNRVRHLIS